jgi:hypothetical protein
MSFAEILNGKAATNSEWYICFICWFNGHLNGVSLVLIKLLMCRKIIQALNPRVWDGKSANFKVKGGRLTSGRILSFLYVGRSDSVPELRVGRILDY